MALVVAVYLPTLSNGFVWDDDDYVQKNATLRSLAGLVDVWTRLGAVPQYYPLVHTTFWIEYHLWGLDPRGYHVVNLLLHAAAAVLAWRLLARLGVPGAWLAAALFAVHPVSVESVAWVTERKNVLSCVLALGALLSFFRFAPPEAPPTADSAVARRKWGFYLLALALYVGALLSKTVTAVVPAVILVVFWWKRGRLSWRDAAPLVPFFAVGLALASITAWMEKHHVGAQGDDWSLTALERVLIAGRALWFYALKLVWPQPLMFFYPRWQIDAGAWWQYLFPLGALAVPVGLWLLRGRIGRGPLAAALIFAGVLVPALGFFDVFPFRYSFVADHFQYHASIALLALVAAALATAATLGPRARGAAVFAAGALVALLAVVAHQRAKAFHDLMTLYRDTIAKNPACWAAQTTVGNYLSRDGKQAEALAHLREAVRLAPNRPELRANLGSALILVGRYDEAIAELQAALEINPRSAQALYNYGCALGGKGDLLGGIEKVERALAIKPQDDRAHHELGAMWMALNAPDEAAGPFAEAVRLNGDNARYRRDLAEALLRLGRIDPAEAQLRRAIRLAPRDAQAHNLLGIALMASGQLDSAVGEFRESLAIDPRQAAAQANLQRAQQMLSPKPKPRL